ncbi:hypothetical protein D3C86_2168050 [compost metagenome]
MANAYVLFMSAGLSHTRPCFASRRFTVSYDSCGDIRLLMWLKMISEVPVYSHVISICLLIIALREITVAMLVCG